MTKPTYHQQIDEILKDFESGRRFDGDTGTDYFAEARQAISELIESEVNERINQGG